MSFGAQDIGKKTFRIAFHGYKMKEVDDFLDFMAVEFDKLQKRNAELESDVKRLSRGETQEGASGPEPGEELTMEALAERIKMLEKREC